MKKIKLLIVEDDLYNQRAVEKIIVKHFSEIEIVGCATGVNEAIDKIEKLQPQLLLLDINLSDGTSFDVLRKSKFRDSKVVFMSAYHEYALEALQFSAVEFVFKPFDINELIVAIDKALEQLQDDNYSLRINTLFDNIDNTNNKKVVLQGRRNIKVCDINDIVWGKAIPGGANFYFSDGSYFFTTTPLRRYEAILPSDTFFRCHPHYLINLKQVKKIDKDLLRIKLSNDDEVIFEERRYNLMSSKLELSMVI
ncbi:LytR/AlgR family response regulator transcription factor [Carboxylicivirga sp. N1Y90]|uniref:LytR/AlgR family response regulator transcription factor n=1 Tax=Carboxylicivirga fragile TaxID=3417571 RepID=UPI003D32F5B6|nr:response regulator transcription factor [Marinilabiliaceae bacterium N1Y90]